MNKQRRKQLEDISEKLQQLRDELDSVMEEEQEAYDNMPESLQESERGCTMQEGLDNLQSVIDSLESDVMDVIQEVIEQ